MNTARRRSLRCPLLLAGLVLLAGPLGAQDIALPAPRGTDVTINRILAARHDTAAFAPVGLPQQTVADVLWASTGINRPATGGRTSNYSYASRDDEIYLLCAQGVFIYDQLEHRLTLQSATDLRATLGAPAATAPLTLVLVSYSGSIDFFGSIHTGFIAENIALACADRGLGAHLSATVPAGLATALGLAANHQILLLQSLGYPEGTPVTAPAWTVSAGSLVPAAVNDAPALAILKRRRSTRSFAATAFSTQTIADLLWAGGGVNNPSTDERTAPLIAGVNDVDLYVALATGVYVYRPGAGAAHLLHQVSTTDLRSTLGYGAVPAIFVYVSDYAKLPAGSNKQRLASLHAGLISQNVAAYAAAEGLGELVRSDPVGSISKATLQLTADQTMLFTQTLGNMASPIGASTVAITAGTGGTITGTASQTIAFGATGTPVTAIPATEYTFASWSGLPGGRVKTNPLALPNVTCTMTLMAVFAAEPTTYAGWRNESFTGNDLTDDTVSGPGADPDSAGVTNLQRYAFGLAPRGPVAPPAALGSVLVGPDKFLTLTFARRPTATDLSYVVEGSSDLAGWLAIPAVLSGTPVTATDTIAIGSTPRRFLRVRVQPTP